MLEQLKEQGYDAEFPVVEPSYAEKFAALEEMGIPTVTQETLLKEKLQEMGVSDDLIDDIIAKEITKEQMKDVRSNADINALRDAGVSEATIDMLLKEQKTISAQDKEQPSDDTEQESVDSDDSDDFFAPTAGFYTGYYANMAIFIPEGFSIDRYLTTEGWKTAPKALKMRYIVLNDVRSEQLSGGVGAFGVTAHDVARIYNYYMAIKENLAFPNATQYEACHKAWTWTGIDSNDYDGFGHKSGRMDPYGPENLNKEGKSHELTVLQGYKDEVKLIQGGKGPGLWTDEGFGKWADDIGKAVGDFFSNLAFQAFGGKTSKKKSKKKGWFW
jgi:hypothetical protein